MHQFKDLKVWQKGRKLVKVIYKLTQRLPKDEQYGLSSQMRRAAISIPANIAEGCGRNGDKELNRFLDIANGSAYELETLVTLCFDLDYITQAVSEEFVTALNEIQKMIFGLKQSVSNSTS